MRSVLVIFILLFSITSCSQGLKEMTPAKWSADLDYLSEKILKQFALFTDQSKQKFLDSVASLKERLPAISNEEAAVAFNKIVALLDDGHTELNLLQSAIDFDRLPVVAWYFQNDLVIILTDDNYSHLLGSKIKKIGSDDIETVRKKIIPLLAHDNDVEYQLEIPNYMTAVPVLNILGITNKTDQIELTIETPGGDIKKEFVKPVSRSEYTKTNWKRLRPIENPPLYFQHFDKYYWFQYLEEPGILYFKISNSNNQRQEKNLGSVINDFFIEYKKVHPAKVVIDLRLNRGGNYDRTTKLAEGLNDIEELHEKGKLWVVTDRHTFSAAVVLAAQIKRFTGALIIGEEARGNPNGCDNYEEYTLPNSKISFGVTNRIKNHYPATLGSPYLPLDVPVKVTISEYKNGADPILDYIKNYKN